MLREVRLLRAQVTGVMPPDERLHLFEIECDTGTGRFARGQTTIDDALITWPCDEIVDSIELTICRKHFDVICNAESENELFVNLGMHVISHAHSSAGGVYAQRSHWLNAAHRGGVKPDDIKGVGVE
jgi:hypothetical protein